MDKNNNVKIDKLNSSLQKASQLIKDNPTLLASVKRSGELANLGDLLNNTAGIVNLNWTNEEKNAKFGFPFEFAKTYETMHRNPIVNKIYSSRTSKILLGEWNISYKDKTLLNDPHHRFVIEYLLEQIENTGGMREFIRDNVIPALKFGVSIFAPTFDIETREFNGEDILLTKIDNFYWYHPAFLFRVFMDGNNLNRVASLQYWIPDKASVTFDISSNEMNDLSEKITKRISPQALRKLADDPNYEVTRQLSYGGNITLTDIDISLVMGGVVSYNKEGSNPIGKAYTYTLYGLSRVVDSLINSLYTSLDNVGFHSIQAVPLNAANGLSYTAEHLLQLKKELGEFFKNGGGLFTSNTHELKEVPTTQVQYINDLIDELYSIMTKLQGESVEALGSGQQSMGFGGGEVAKTLQENMTPEIDDDAQQLIKGLNKTFIQYFIDINFKHWFDIGLLKQYPTFTWGESEQLEEILKDEQTESEIDPVDNPQEGDSNDTDNNPEHLINDTHKEAKASTFWIKRIMDKLIKREVKASSETFTSENTRGNFTESEVKNGVLTKKVYVKRDPNGIVEELTIDVEDMERTFLEAEIKIRDQINNLVRDKIPDIVAESKGDINKIDREIKKLHKEIVKEIQEVLGANSSSFANLYMNMYNKSIKALKQKELTPKQQEQALNKVFKQLRDKFKKKADLSAYIIEKRISEDIASIFTRGLNLSQDELTQFALQRYSIDSNYNYTSFARDLVMYESDEISKDLAKQINSTDNPVALVRTAILEGSCDHCKTLDGVVYYIDPKTGDIYNREGTQYYDLPDTNCSGVKGNNTCRCNYLPVSRALVDLSDQIASKRGLV